MVRSSLMPLNLVSFFIYLESNAVILISGSRSVYLGEVSDFPEMTERTRLISYLLYGLYGPGPSINQKQQLVSR